MFEYLFKYHSREAKTAEFLKTPFGIPWISAEFYAYSDRNSEVKTSGGIPYRRNSVDTLL
jgi:hypothetical protein